MQAGLPGPREYYPTAGVGRFARPDKKLMQCPNCGSTWLQEIIVNQFDADATKHIGSKATRINDTEFYLYICARCNQPVEQPLHYLGIMDQARTCHEEIIQLLTQRSLQMRQPKHEASEQQQVSPEGSQPPL